MQLIGGRARRSDEWAGAISDANRPCVHVVVESTDGERVRVLVEAFHDRMATWRKEEA